MEKIKFTFEDAGESVEFFVLEQTKLNGSVYILVTDSQEDDAECLILKETASKEDGESIYEVVEDDTELLAVSKLFEEFLEDVDIDEVDGNQRKYDGIHPTHHTADSRILRLLPKRPRYFLCDINIENERNNNQSPPTPYPEEEDEVK